MALTTSRPRHATCTLEAGQGCGRLVRAGAVAPRSMRARAVPAAQAARVAAVRAGQPGASLLGDAHGGAPMRAPKPFLGGAALRRADGRGRARAHALPEEFDAGSAHPAPGMADINASGKTVSSHACRVAHCGSQRQRHHAIHPGHPVGVMRCAAATRCDALGPACMGLPAWAAWRIGRRRVVLAGRLGGRHVQQPHAQEAAGVRRGAEGAGTRRMCRQQRAGGRAGGG